MEQNRVLQSKKSCSLFYYFWLIFAFFSCEMLDVLPLQASKHDLKESWKKSFFGGSVWWGLRVTLKLLYTTKCNIMCVGSKTLASQPLRPWSGKIHDECEWILHTEAFDGVQDFCQNSCQPWVCCTMSGTRSQNVVFSRLLWSSDSKKLFAETGIQLNMTVETK